MGFHPKAKHPPNTNHVLLLCAAKMTTTQVTTTNAVVPAPIVVAEQTTTTTVQTASPCLSCPAPCSSACAPGYRGQELACKIAQRFHFPVGNPDLPLGQCAQCIEM